MLRKVSILKLNQLTYLISIPTYLEDRKNIVEPPPWILECDRRLPLKIEPVCVYCAQSQVYSRVVSQNVDTTYKWMYVIF